jgi:phage-related protein
MKHRKPLIWVGSSKKDLLYLSENVRRMMGYSLNLAQQGIDDLDSTIMKGFGSAHVREITKDDEGGTYRTIYTVKFGEAIYVLHVFQKKSKKGIATPKQEMDKVKARLKEAQQIHENQQGKDENKI